MTLSYLESAWYPDWIFSFNSLESSVKTVLFVPELDGSSSPSWVVAGKASMPCGKLSKSLSSLRSLERASATLFVASDLW